MPQVYRSACSDPLVPEALNRWAAVEEWLFARGLSTATLEPGRGPWRDPDWKLVADPSGGSKAVGRLPDLMTDLPPSPGTPCRSRAWWSMSDNTVVLNALLDRGLCRVLHGHPLTLAGREAGSQRARFELWSEALFRGEPFPAGALPPLHLLRGPAPEVLTLLGGNLSALERLGETPWRPRPRARAFLIESFSCTAHHAPHRVSALAGDAWWEGISALVLGRFTVADREPSWIEACLTLLPPELSVFRLPLVGHGADGWTVPLGEPLSFSVRNS